MRFFITLLALLLATLVYAQDNIILRNGDEIPATVLEVNQIDLKYRKLANPTGPIYTSPLRDVLLIKYANGTKDTFNNARQPAPGRPRRPDMGMGAPTLPMAPPMDAAPGLDGLRYHRGLFSRYYVGGNGQRMGIAEAKPLFMGQPDALMAYDRGRSLRTWSQITAVSAIALVGTGAGLAIANGRFGGRDGRRGNDNDPMANGGFQGNNERGDRRNGEVVGAALAGGGVLLGVAAIWLDCRATMQFRRAANRYTNRQPTTLRLAPTQRGIGAVLTF